MKKKNWLRLAVSIFLMVAVVVGLVMMFVVKPTLEREATLAKYPDRGVPRINIDLSGVSLDEIKAGSKDVKYEGNQLTLYDEDEAQKFNGVQVKGRGNGTWVQEKKPYQIRFQDKVDLFGLGKARKWVLLANALDGTGLRTDIAFYLERMLGMVFALDGEFVELYIDGEYEGLYYLTHVVEIGKNTVDLRDPMGVLVELDNIYGEGELNLKTGNGDIVAIKDAVKKDNAEAALKEFLDSYNQLEKAVAEKDYDKIKELADVDSFAKYYLLSEFTVNPDAYWTSFFMYKDGSGDKIHAGPGWDFDLALANRAWGNWMGEDFYSPNKTMVRKDEIMTREMYEEMGLIEDGGMDWHEWSLGLSRIVFNLMEIPEVREEVEIVYMNKMEGREDELVREIGRKQNNIRDAMLANEALWGREGFDQEVDAVKGWIKGRYEYFDEIYGGGRLMDE
ncbi:CotH kinase family protein [Candidatus Saccharibacteria bacterium]|nr:CotH kinase family protein [Candidatus Saccharibacteria bacterium]